MARTPKGGDTDQIKAVAAGECGVALSNTYYYVRLLRSTKPERPRDRQRRPASSCPTRRATARTSTSPARGVLKNAPNKENAIKFLEYLASDEAQRYFANGNNEWPAVKGVVAANPVLESLGKFKADALPIASLGKSIARRRSFSTAPGIRSTDCFLEACSRQPASTQFGMPRAGCRCSSQPASFLFRAVARARR